MLEFRYLQYIFDIWGKKKLTYKGVWGSVAQCQGVEDFFIINSSFSLQDVAAFLEVSSEGFLQKEVLG